LDYKHPRPGKSSLSGNINRASSQSSDVSNSASATLPLQAHLPSYLRSAHNGYDMPEDAPVKSARSIIGYATNNQANQGVIKFASNAKIYKRKALARRVYHVLLAITVVLVLIVVALGGVGFYLNSKYVGKALPFAKIGNLSVGGMDRAQITSLLNETSSNLTVTFNDGGLYWTEPVSTFNPKYDFNSAIDQTIAKRFNPYTFLTKTQVPVAVQVNERHVEGYLRQNITSMQTRSEDAYLMKGTDAIVVKPEVLGFSANASHVAKKMNESLSQLSESSIRMNSVGVKPNIYSADLQAELTKANTLINNNISVRYNGAVVYPSKKDKLNWLELSQVPGSPASYNFDFSKSKIRDYVVALAVKYQKPVKVEQPDNKENPAGYSVPTVVINNIEQVTDQIYAGLKNNRSTVAIFTKDTTTKRSVPGTAVAGASTTKPVSPSVPSNGPTNASNSSQTTIQTNQVSVTQ
jgi:hypothetical protein